MQKILKQLHSSIRNAWHGIAYTFKKEQNFKIQVGISVIVLILTFLFNIETYEQIVILLLVLLVLILELVNTTIEKFLDVIKPRFHGQVEVIKDVMAGAVLIASIGSVIIGAIIFIPRIIEIFSTK